MSKHDKPEHAGTHHELQKCKCELTAGTISNWVVGQECEYKCDTRHTYRSAPNVIGFSRHESGNRDYRQVRSA